MKKILIILLTNILIISFSYLFFLLNDLGFLANKYILIAGGCLVIFLFIIILGLFKLKKKILKALLVIMCFTIVFINFFGIYYLKSTLSFIDNITNSNEHYSYYYILSLKSSSYNTINDLKDRIIGNTEGLEQEVFDKLKISYESKKYESSRGLLENLYNKQLDAILLSDVEAYLLEEEVKDFTVMTKIVHTIKIKKEEEIEEVSKYEVQKPFIFYISGIDTNGSISKVSRSDVNIVITVNPSTYQVLLTTIPRDYYVQLHGTTGVKDKLTHAGIYGIDKSITTIEDLLSIDINYYARVNFDTVTHLVNKLGGIEIYSDQNLNFCNIKQGYNNLNGECALRFARERKSYQTGDRHRGENQEEVIRAIIHKAQNTPSILTKYNSILTDLRGNFESNVSNDMIKSLIKLQIKDMPKWIVKTSNLNGFDSHNYTYSGGRNKLYVMEPDVTTIDNTKNIINSMLEGKTFDEIGI